MRTLRRALAVLLLLAAPAYGQETPADSLADEIRTETVRMRGFVRASETQATKVLALIDSLRALPADTNGAPAPPDTLPPVQDTLPAYQDTLPPVQDTLPAHQDTLPPVQDTVLVEVCPSGWTCTPPDTTTPPPPDTTANGPAPRTGWPTEPVPPDSLTFDYLQADRGVVVWWWGGDATGWVMRGGNNTTDEVWEPHMFQRGVAGHTVFLAGIGGGGMHLDGPGSYWTCIDAWYDPTQPEHDYTDPNQEPVDRVLPDTLAAGAEKVARCAPFPYPNPDMPVPSYDYRIERENGTMTHGQEPMEPSALIAGEPVRVYLHRIDSCGWALPDSPEVCPGQPLPDSVVFVVEGQRVREQVHPYTFPGGSDDPWTVPDSGPVSFEWQVFGEGAASGALDLPVISP